MASRNRRTATGDRSEERAASARERGAGGSPGGSGVNTVRGGSVCSPEGLPLGVVRGSGKAAVWSALTCTLARKVRGLLAAADGAAANAASAVNAAIPHTNF